MPESEPTNQTSADACARYEANEKLNGHINAASSHLAQSQAPIFPPAKPHPQVTNLSSAQESLPKFSDYLMSVSLASGIVALAAVLLRRPQRQATTIKALAILPQISSVQFLQFAAASPVYSFQ